MNAPSTIPNNSTHDVITFDILTNGQLVPGEFEILSIDISKEVNRIPTAYIDIRDGDAALQTFEISNTDHFIPGKDIHIKLGRDGENGTVFKGIITKHSIRFRENGTSSLMVECKDLAVKMTIGRHSQYFENKKDSEVIEDIVGNYSGLNTDVEATSLVHKELVQHHSSDWDFILTRAELNGKLVTVNDGTITVKKPDTSQEPTLALQYGATMLEFHAEMDAKNQYKKVKARAWDYANQQLFEAETENADFTEHGNISGATLAETINLDELELQHSGQVIEEELNDWANACMLKSRLSKIRGHVKTIEGFSDIKPGQLVDLHGVGNRFNGKAYVSAVRHEIAVGAWYTFIQFGLSPDWFASKNDVVDFPAAGLTPSIYGLQVGKVNQLQNDPDGEDRILVKLPTTDNTANGTWARIASLDAGDNRGAFFRPEIGDEVIVGFIKDDPRDAIVLGMLHSSAKPAPITAQDVNHEKGFTTRSEMHLLFNDDTKTITIDTPAGNSIVIDEASQSIKITDQSNNTVTMEPSGITVDSPADIKVKAGASMTLEAATSLDIKAANISIKATGPFSAEGATAKLKGQGITEVTGSLVKIN